MACERISKVQRIYNIYTHNLGSGLPLGSLGKLVHGLDVLEQGTDSRFPDTLVVVVKQVNENLDGLLNVGHESRLSGSKELSDGVGCDLLLDGDSAVHLGEHVVQSCKVSVVLLIVKGFASVLAGTGRHTESLSKLGRVGVALLVKLLRNFALLAARDKSRDTLGKVLSELAGEDLGHDAEKDEGRLPKTRVVHGKGLEGGLHERLEVRTEDLSTDGISNCTDSVGGNTSKVVLFVILVELEERNESLDGLTEVRDELFFGGVGSRTDSTGDSDLDGNAAALKEDEKSLHEEGEVVDNVVTEDFQIRIETSARVLLGGRVNNEVEEDGDNDGMSGSALLSEPLAKTTESDTSGFSDNDLTVLKTTLDHGPELVNVRSDILAATLYGDTESHKSGLSHTGVTRGHVDLKLLSKNGEDLLGRKNLGEVVKGSESESRR